MKEFFPLLKNNPGIVYFDTAATSQKPEAVLDAERKFYETSNANVHRSAHVLAERATKAFEDSRNKTAQFINAEPDEIVFCSGTTLALNISARAIFEGLKPGDQVLVTIMEHHSNFVVWQQLAKKFGLKFDVVPITPDFRLDLEVLKEKLNENTKVFACTHVSNVLGTINQIVEIGKIVRENSPQATFVVDGAQAVAHMPVDVKALDVDVYCFGAHKMYGPSGIGVLYAKRELLKAWPPVIYGGEMVEKVTVEDTLFKEGVAKFEAGTPTLAQAVGLSAAIDFIQKTGWVKIQKIEQDVLQYLLDSLKNIAEITIIGPDTIENRIGDVSVLMKGWHPHDFASTLDMQGIAVRAGSHCTHPLHCALGLEHENDIGTGKEVFTIRISLGVYNTKDDVDRLIKAINTMNESYDPASIDVDDEVIKEHIRDHVLNPRNKKDIEGHSCLGKNPNCGDTIKATVVVSEDKIKEVAFMGDGCAISQATMSILTTKLKGMSVIDVQELDLSFVNKITGIDFSTKPVRARCAMLGLRATQCAIREVENGNS